MKKYIKIIVFLAILGVSWVNAYSQDIAIKLLSYKDSNFSLERALNERRSIRSYNNLPLSLQETSQILWSASGKNKWGKFTNPSAMTSYPLTIYFVAINIEGVPAGLYRYNNKTHELILARAGNLHDQLILACMKQGCIKQAAALVVITTDSKVAAAHYGKNASMYVDMEAGHIGQNIYLAATAWGLGTVAVGAFSPEEVKKILVINQDPVYIFPLGKLNDSENKK